MRRERCVKKCSAVCSSLSWGCETAQIFRRVTVTVLSPSRGQGEVVKSAVVFGQCAASGNVVHPSAVAQEGTESDHYNRRKRSQIPGSTMTDGKARLRRRSSGKVKVRRPLPFHAFIGK